MYTGYKSEYLFRDFCFDVLVCNNMNNFISFNLYSHCIQDITYSYSSDFVYFFVPLDNRIHEIVFIFLFSVFNSLFPKIILISALICTILVTNGLTLITYCMLTLTIDHSTYIIRI